MVVQFLALKLFKWKESTPKSADHHFPPPNCHWDFHPPFFGRPTSQPPIPCLSWKYAANACCSNSSRGTTASATGAWTTWLINKLRTGSCLFYIICLLKTKTVNTFHPLKPDVAAGVVSEIAAKQPLFYGTCLRNTLKNTSQRPTGSTFPTSWASLSSAGASWPYRRPTLIN